MDIEWIREVCLAFPGTTEDVQWGDSLLFRIAGKIYASVNLAAAETAGSGKSLVTFKCTPEEFAELLEVEAVIPAPYLARNHWVSLTRLDALPRAEIRRRLARSYELVRAKLPKKIQRELEGSE